MASRTYTVVYEPVEGGGYHAHIPALNVTTEGETLGEAQEIARDAIEGSLEAAKLIGKAIPEDVTVERVEVAT